MERTTIGWAWRFAVIVGAAVASIVGIWAGRAAADAWADQNCGGGFSTPAYWKRSQASAYAQPPLREGYLLDGGCYKLNDRDDTPALAADGGGEGTDCSGFVFRVWALKTDSSNGYRRWDYTKYIHGPWYSWDFKDPRASEPFRNIPKDNASTDVMDAIAWFRDGGDDRHIALLWSEGKDSDYFVHAHTNTAGVEISEEIYRQQPDTEAVMRRNWSLECEPKCPTPGLRRRG
jgi:hypothetical protein